MIGRSLGGGLVRAVRHPGLTAIPWAWNLALASLGTLPFWAWLAGVSSRAPETDRLLNGLNVGAYVEMIQAAPGAMAGLGIVTAAVLVLALVSNAFLTGGILHGLVGSGEERRLLGRSPFLECPDQLPEVVFALEQQWPGSG